MNNIPGMPNTPDFSKMTQDEIEKYVRERYKDSDWKGPTIVITDQGSTTYIGNEGCVQYYLMLIEKYKNHKP